MSKTIVGHRPNAHMVLPNTTSTDIFCSGQSLMTTGDVLVTGGDLTVDGGRNFANNHTEIFSPTTSTLTANTPMQYPRWYPSLVALPDGRLAVFGGYQNNAPPLNDPVIPAATPEIYDPATRVWMTLTGAASDAAFGTSRTIGIIPGPMLLLAVTSLSLAMMELVLHVSRWRWQHNRAGGECPGYEWLPTINFAPGKVLSIRQSLQVVVVDFTQSVPVITRTDNIDQERDWASGTIMADGKVLVTGGSTVPNELPASLIGLKFGTRRPGIGQPVPVRR